MIIRHRTDSDHCSRSIFPAGRYKLSSSRRRRCAEKREPRGLRGSPRQRHAANLGPQGPEKRSKTPNRRRFTAVGGAVLSRSVGGAKHPADGAAELITH